MNKRLKYSIGGLLFFICVGILLLNFGLMSMTADRSCVISNNDNISHDVTLIITKHTGEIYANESYTIDSGEKVILKRPDFEKDIFGKSVFSNKYDWSFYLESENKSIEYMFPNDRGCWVEFYLSNQDGFIIESGASCY